MSLDHFDAPNGSYTSLIPPGTNAFRWVVAEHFGYTRTEVVRDQSRCNNQGSEHCECGAIDCFTTNVAKGRKLFDWCVEVANPLGIQSVIFNRRVIGFGNPNERHYSGSSPHTDHVHIGLNRWARRNLTQQMVRALLPGQEDDLPYTEAQLKAFMKDAAEAAVKDVAETVSGIRKAVVVMMKNPVTGKSEPVNVDRIVLAIAAIGGVTEEAIAQEVFNEQGG